MSVRSRRPRSLWPREHGAYIQLFVPLATSLLATGSSWAGDALALGAGFAFFASVAAAATVAMVDLSLDGVTAAVTSEHSALHALVVTRAPDLTSIAPDQIAYLAGTAGVSPDRVRAMVQAAQLAKDAGGAIDPEVFYGLLRTGHEGDLAALAAVPVETQRARLERAIVSNVIAKTREPQIDAILGALSNAIVARAMPATGATVVSAALANSLAGRDLQTTFVTRWISRAGSVEDFWADLRADPKLGATADELETTLRLDMLFDGFQPALADLRSSRQAGTVKSLRDLARWQDSDWAKFLARVGTPPGTFGDTPADKVTTYIAKVSTAVRAAFPSEYLRGRAAVPPTPIATKYVSVLVAANPDLDLMAALPDTPNWGAIAAADQPSARAEWTAFQREALTFRRTSARTLLDTVVKSGGQNPIRTAANQVLAGTTGFDLEHTTIDQYLAANPKALDGVAAAIRPTVLGYLKGVQRMLRIVGKPDAIEPMIADGLDSAMRIVRVSRTEFVERYAPALGGAAPAHEVFSTAFRAATTAQLALTTSVQAMADVSPWAIRGGSTSKFTRPDYASVFGMVQQAAGAADGSASWPTLFEGEAWCDCEDCKSIYGPAAYFVDLLHMIDPDTNQTPADQLFARRPDLKNLSLSCDNTNTPLPYIDVVNEILELYVAVDRGYVDPKTQLKYAISTSYDSTGLSATELRAVPQNVIDEVYESALAESAYPFTLPMRRSLAVMRTYLGQLGTTYRDVLVAFGSTAADEGVTPDERLAAETLGLTRRQFELIAGIATLPAVTLPECYGYAAQDAQWQSKLAVVPELLVRTRIALSEPKRQRAPTRGGVGISSRSNTVLTLAAATDVVAHNTVTGLARTSASTKTMTTLREMAYEPATALRAQKSFGLEELAMNPIKKVTPSPPYCFEPLHHPFVRSLVKRLERDGVDGMLATGAQNPDGSDHGELKKHFDNTFAPSKKLVAYPYSPHDVDFRPQGPYAPYNWELFFHAPYLIAARLMQDGRYDDARSWLHHIFDPTTSSTESVPARFWKLQPFRDNNDTLDASQLMTALATNSPADVAASVNAQIDQWIRYPADPHRIARLRLSAYQKAIVFKYVDNPIAWADSLFTQDTIETINQATQLYVFASHLLGPRPDHVPQDTSPPAFTYAQLRGHLDRMSDMVEEVEALMLPATAAKSAPHAVAYSLLGISHLPIVWQAMAAPDEPPDVPLMFCVPANTKLLGYYDTLEDRLFKIRHCMNIEGVVQQLPLFQPPIDPALLVRAAAMGLDIGSILSDLAAPLPFHRFNVLVQRAFELCSELKSLGGQLLSALEKQDAESLALIRATQDRALLQAVLDVKKQQVKDAEIGKTALQRTRDTTQARVDYYASRTFLSPLEDVQLEVMLGAAAVQLVGGLMSMAASAAASVPDFDVGPTGMGAHGTAKYGGTAVGNIAGYTGEALSMAAQAAQTGAGAAGILAGHTRRKEEWAFQQELATKELAQIDQQLAGADIRIAIANLDVSNQQLQIDNAAKIETTLRTKYTNTELYSWMVTQISTTYYQAYKLAYDLAKRAERCYRYELGIESSSFVQFGYWDSLRKGLLAGEQLALDLKRMDASYLQLDRREYEITRQISLVLQDPQAFAVLRQKGSCEIDLPEELLDADYPGHYFRRIKNVSLTLPCVAGPYTPINCTLTLLASHVRVSAIASSSADSYPEHNAPNDARFSHTYGSIQSVATSHGQSDAGMFEVNFRDERYLPFEGAGAISRWRIDLPRDCNAFDPDTLSDVVLKLSYTARDGGKPLADAARKSLRARWQTTDTNDAMTPTTPLRRLFRVRYEYSDNWVQFRNALASGAAALSLTIDRDRFPYQFRGVPIQIVGVQLVAALVSSGPSLVLTVTPPQGAAKDLTLVPPTPVDPSALVLVSEVLAPPPVDVAATTGWTVAAKAGFPIANVRDLAIIVTYTAKLPPYVS